jgi:excisionase family DNA binding protein
MNPPSDAQSNPNQEAAGRPILPKKWDGKATFNVAEVAEIFGMNTWVIYDLIKREEMRAVKIGRLVKIPRHVIEEMLAV